MKKPLCLLMGILSALSAIAQPVRNQPGRDYPVRNDFFVLHNAIRGDSTYKTFDEQVAFIKSLGYDGVEINQLESFEGMKAALDKHHFTGSYFYIRINLDTDQVDPRIAPDIRALKGSKTILSPFIVGGSKRFAPSSPTADTLIVQHLKQIGDWAKTAGLQVALYPHVGFYVERVDHALRLVQQTNRPNVGLTFNLCHWLATTPKADRANWKGLLRTLKPHLNLMTICGANNVAGQSAGAVPGEIMGSNNPPGGTVSRGIWEQYILPLGTGSFDTYELVRYAIQDLGFRGPIGVQFYSLPGDKPTNLRQTMAVWQEYKARLAKR